MTEEKRRGRPRKEGAANRAKAAYSEKNYERIAVVLPKGMREPLQKKAAEQGVSVNRYILEAVEKQSGLKLTLDKPLPWVSNSAKKNEQP